MTHDYTRNGVTTWFAALTRLTGPVRSMTEGRASGLPLHRHQAWRHFPPHSSWLNRVERFFRDITHPRIRRGGFNRVAELQGAINDYIAVHNAKPFI